MGCKNFKIGNNQEQTIEKNKPIKEIEEGEIHIQNSY